VVVAVAVVAAAAAGTAETLTTPWSAAAPSGDNFTCFHSDGLMGYLIDRLA